jgi:hypothetical protein
MENNEPTDADGSYTLTLTPPRLIRTPEYLTVTFDVSSSVAGWTQPPLDFNIPRALFGGDTKAEDAFIDRVEEITVPESGNVIAWACYMLLADAIHVAAYLDGPPGLRQENPAEVERAVVQVHIHNERIQVTRRVRSMMGLPRARGRRSQWEALSLRLAVIDALTRLDETDWNYDKVQREMHKAHGSKAPQSGEALRKLLKRFKLDWDEIKAAVKTGQ